MTKGVRWTAEELERLSACYASTPKAALLEMLPGRPFEGIRQKANDLGLQRNGSVSWSRRDPLRRPLAEAELAYIAAIVDGEGHIGFTKGRRGSGKWLLYTPRVGVSNQSEALIRWMDDRIAWTTRSLSVDTSGHSWAYKPVLSGHGAAILLRALLPYLVIKGDRAELVIKFCDSRASMPGNVPYTPEQLSLVERVYELNKKRAQPTSALHLSRRSA